MHTRFFIAAAMTLASGVAFANDKVIEKPIAADTPEKFAQIAKQIREDMAGGGRYEFIRPDEKVSVETDLNTIADMLQKAGSVAAMPDKEKSALLNTQEHLNGILTLNDRNRLVCESRASAQTSIPVTSCKTLGEIEVKRNVGQTMMWEAAMAGISSPIPSTAPWIERSRPN